MISAAIQQMENKQHFIGGNAALMARTMKSYGIEVTYQLKPTYINIIKFEHF